MKIVIDAENGVLGRLASYSAKHALQGNEVVIINCGKVIISGNKKNILEKYSRLRGKGGTAQKGPIFPTLPDRIVKRTIRGMINYKSGRGKVAIDKIKCYNNIPEEYKDTKKIKSKRHGKGIRLEEISKLLRGGK